MPKREIYLNVAAGCYPVKGFVNLDNHIFMLALDYPLLNLLVPRKNRDLLKTYQAATSKASYIRHDCRKALPYPENSIAHILCSHFLEHVYPDEAENILKDYWRVLRPGATIHIIVPDLEALIMEYVEAKMNNINAADRFIVQTLLSTTTRGSLKYRVLEMFGGFGLKHRWMYDSASMAALIGNIGFKILDTNDTPSKDYRKGDASIHIVAQKLA